MDEVEILCDRIGILKDGGFVFEGTVQEAVALSPLSLYIFLVFSYSDNLILIMEVP